MGLCGRVALFYCKKGKQTYLRFLLFAPRMSTRVNGRNIYAFPTAAVPVVALTASTTTTATTRTVIRHALVYL
jgi:hypothetical protein